MCIYVCHIGIGKMPQSKKNIPAKNADPYPRKKSRCWMWTINNWTDADVDELSAMFNAVNGPSYIIAGKEVGDKEQTPHLQCFATWHRGQAPKQWSWLRKRLTRAAAIAPMFSTIQACLEYCAKDGDVFEWGDRPKGQGKGKLDDIRTAIEEGESRRDISTNYFGAWVRYNKAFAAYRDMQIEERYHETRVVVLYGPTGSGKTTEAYKRFPDLHQMQNENGFFSDYQYQEKVLWNDFRGDWMKPSTFLQLADKWPAKLRVMYGWRQWVPHLIFITSNSHPKDWWDIEKVGEETVKAVLRRCEIEYWPLVQSG